MADVARLAGVSTMTVSRVVNGNARVTGETRHKVEAAMERLQFRRNSSARALKTGRTGILGVVSSNTRLHGPASTLVGVEVAAREDDYFVHLETMRRIDSDSVLDSMARLGEQRVEGIVVMAPTTEMRDALLDVDRGSTPPFVAVQGPREASMPCVAVDQRAGARAATEHLLALGHETVTFLAGPRDWLEAVDREAAWRETLRGAGRPVTEPLVGDWSAASGYRLAEQLLTDEVTAVFSANDQMALGVLRAAYEHGRRVPEDLSIVGFDDLPESPFFSPPLTTVRQPFDVVGERAHELLLRLIEGGDLDDRELPVMVQPELQERGSTAPPKG